MTKGITDTVKAFCEGRQILKLDASKNCEEKGKK